MISWQNVHKSYLKIHEYRHCSSRDIQEFCPSAISVYLSKVLVSVLKLWTIVAISTYENLILCLFRKNSKNPNKEEQKQFPLCEDFILHLKLIFLYLFKLLSGVLVCRTGEAKISKGYDLAARHVIHAVGPRYNVKYKTAAENALFNAYRNTLLVLRSVLYISDVLQTFKYHNSSCFQFADILMSVSLLHELL